MNLNENLQIEIIGFTAGGLIIISLIPQLVTIIQNKSSKNISIPTYLVLLIAQIIWISYSILKNDMIILATNLSTAIITLFIIGFLIYFRHIEKYNTELAISHT